MRQETPAIIQKLLTEMETCKVLLNTEEAKQDMDEYMFCLRNYYTKEESERHIANKFPSLTPVKVRIFRDRFEKFIVLMDKEARQAYLRGVELRSAQLRAAEAKRVQVEPSTFQTCGPNCTGVHCKGIHFVTDSSS